MDHPDITGSNPDYADNAWYMPLFQETAGHRCIPNYYFDGANDYSKGRRPWIPEEKFQRLGIFSPDYILGEESFIITILTDWDYVKFILLSFIIILALSAWGYYFIKEKYYYWIGYFSTLCLFSFSGSFLLRKFLSNYQIERLIIFLDPFKDERGFGMQTIQSMNAIGSGGFWGKGLFNGTQSQLNYIPQQSTDFIFSILAEEWGFIGGLFILALFLIMLLRGIRIISITKDNYAINIGTGIIAMIFFHIIVNIGMTIGIMPITGIPVFLLSYGGSSLWTAAIGIGILLDIYLRRYRY